MEEQRWNIAADQIKHHLECASCKVVSGLVKKVLVKVLIEENHLEDLLLDSRHRNLVDP